jgi:hypothetical protein
MPEDLRPISLDNIPDVIRLWNESSRGTSLEYHLDMFGLLNFSRYWNLSFKHSLVRYVENVPAALMLNCTDQQTRSAYTSYWGTLPQFRTQNISISLFDACCQRLRDDGYETLYGVSLTERPAKRYRFIQAYPQYRLIDMRCERLNLPDTDPGLSVRAIEAALLSQVHLPPQESLHWSQRPAFLTNAVPMIQTFGAFSGDELKAYAVIPSATPSTLLDIRSPEMSRNAGFDLLRFLTANYGPILDATHVLDQGYASRLLADCGFTEIRRYSGLIRNLLTTTSPIEPS